MSITAEVHTLRLANADSSLIFKLKQENDELEKQKNHLTDDVDVNFNLATTATTKDNELIENLNDEQEKRRDLEKELENNIKEKTQLLEEKEKFLRRIAFLEEDNKNLKVSQEKMLEDKGFYEREYNALLMQLKESKQLLADKMNEINNLEEQVKKREQILKKEQEFFEKTKKDWDDKRLQYERAVKQQQQQQQQQGSGRKSLGSEKEELPDFGFLPRMEDFTSEKKNRDFPRTIVKRLLKHHENEIYCVAYNINGSVLASCAADRTIKFYDPLNQENLGTIAAAHGGEKFYTSINFSNVSDILIVGATDNTAELINYNTRKSLHKLTGHTARINDVGFLNDRNKCVTVSADRSLKFWDVNKGIVQETVNCGSPARCVDHFNFEPFVVTGHADGSVRLFSVKDGKLFDSIKNLHENKVTCVKISSNNYHILSCSQDGSSIKLYDTRIKRVIMTYTDDSYFNNHEFNRVTFGPDDKTIIAPNGDGSIIVWSTDTGKKRESLLSGIESTMLSCTYCPVTGQMISADTRGNLLFWN